MATSRIGCNHGPDRTSGRVPPVSGPPARRAGLTSRHFPPMVSSVKFLPLVPIAAVLSPGIAGAVSLITLDFSGAMTAVQRQAFIDAADYWNSAITGYDLNYNAVGETQAHGLTITASISAIDGSGGILASAGPDTATYYDDNPLGSPTRALYYTRTGTMEFDSADASRLISNNTYYGVVLHEMAHVLGIGTLWTFNNDVNGTLYSLYLNGSGQYTGPNALAAWQTEFLRSADTFVPVELGGGSGTADGHWDEIDYAAADTGITSNLTGMDFSRELMTGWASGEFFVSTVTLAALDDLGYTVDYSKAGIIDHIPVPEPALPTLALAASALLLQRRRRS